MENTMPLVSIVVPVYKTEKYIYQCIESLVNQTYKCIEIILVDDGSPDNCPKICDEYLKRESRVVVVHKQNGGASSARKAGIDVATGQYLMLVDSDDWIELDTVEKCVNIAIDKNVECVMFSYVKEYQKHSINNPIFEKEGYYNAKEAEGYVHRRMIGFRPDELQHPEKIDNMVSVCMKLYRIDIAKRGLIVDEKIVGTSEDTLFNIYALDGCKSIYCLNECLYHYRRADSSSITMNYKKNLPDKWDVLYTFFDQYFEATGTKEKYYEVFLNRVACGMIGLGLNEICADTSLFQKTKNIRNILNKALYKEAFKKLDIEYCPIKWKVFFVLCKLRMAFTLTVLLSIMNYLRSRVSG